MSRYRMADGSVIDTDRASQNWNEAQDWDGSNHISRATDSQWNHETMYRSRKGRYYCEHSSAMQGSRDHVEWVSNEHAASWLLSQDHDLPDDLKALESEIIE